MLFGIGKKKPVVEGSGRPEKPGKLGEDGEKRRRKSQKETGSRWAAMWLLVITLVLGLSFFLYGKLVGNNQVVIGAGQQETQTQGGKIIFEKDSGGGGVLNQEKKTGSGGESMEKNLPVDGEDLVF